MVSHRHHCIFIHIPRTGGTSVMQWLGGFSARRRGQQDHRTIRDIEPLSFGELVGYLRHKHPEAGRRQLCLRYLAQVFGHARHVNRSQYAAYFRFTVVRNPWDRIVSWHGNLMRDPEIREICGVPEDCPFRDFVLGHLHQWATLPQLHWLRDTRGQLPFDRIVRFEHLADELAEVGTLLRIESPLPWLNSGEERPYTEWYEDDTQDAVARMYAAEIAQFGFHYGD